MIVTPMFYIDNENVDEAFKDLNTIFNTFGTDFKSEIHPSKHNANQKVITIEFDLFDLLCLVTMSIKSNAGRKRKVLPNSKELHYYLSQGYTKTDLAKIYNVSRPTLYKRLKENT